MAGDTPALQSEVFIAPFSCLASSCLPHLGLARLLAKKRGQPVHAHAAWCRRRRSDVRSVSRGGATLLLPREREIPRGRASGRTLPPPSPTKRRRDRRVAARLRYD